MLKTVPQVHDSDGELKEYQNIALIRVGSSTRYSTTCFRELQDCITT
jgi:hypothetical protein